MFNQQVANARKIEELKMEKDVVVCHHCHSKVHIVDFCNNKAMMLDSDEEDEEDEDLEMDAIEQM